MWVFDLIDRQREKNFLALLFASKGDSERVVDKRAKEILEVARLNRAWDKQVKRLFRWQRYTDAFLQWVARKRSK